MQKAGEYVQHIHFYRKPIIVSSSNTCRLSSEGDEVEAVDRKESKKRARAEKMRELKNINKHLMRFFHAFFAVSAQPLNLLCFEFNDDLCIQCIGDLLQRREFRQSVRETFNP